jgi:hypothetical protein
MEKIKELFGLTVPNRKVYDFKPGVRTTSAVKHSLTFEQWCKEYKVSMLHNKSIVYFG